MIRVDEVLRSAVGIVLSSIVVLCCGGEKGQTPGLLVRLSSDVGATPTSYAVIVDLADGRISAISCPGDAQDTLACVDEGLRISEPSEQLTVTVKARGFAFFTQQFELGSLPVEDGDAVAAISLDALAPFEQTEDYATGFDSDDGLVAYRSLAHEADTDLGPASVVKFYVDDIASEPRVYFQNTVKHKLHYGFVRNVLGNSLTSAEFWEATYVGLERSAMAGTVIMYDAVRADSQALDQEIAAPLCVTFFPSDNLTPAQAATAHRLIEERIGFAPLIGGQGPVVYLPAGEDQEAALSQETALFARRGALWIVHRELYGNVTQQILNPGLAFGTLRYLTPEALKNAVVSFKDILVLSRLPNSLPIVGGTITEELQTPLAHVNVAARARGTPNMALLDAAADQRIAPFIGKLVRFEVKSGAFTLEETTLDQARAYWESQQKDPVYPEFDLERDGLPSFEEIGFSDSVSVGAKAANLADLSNLLQQTAPHGFAIPFYYYDQFMREGQVTEALCAEASQDCELEGRTAEICNRAEALCIGGGDTPENFWIFAERLIDRSEFESDTELREAVLDSLRYIMRHTEVTPDFADALNSRVDELFGSDKVRLRSSTNAEDLEDFSGAGLYKSVSAYSSGDFKLASDQVRKVWASVWSFGAFEERAFWNIDHLSVQMGVAVNQAFPDEAANGVLITQNIADPTVAGMYVNVQRGEVPVTNPENGAIPEIFSIIPGADSWSVQVARLRYSSLSPDEPILRDAEVEQLYKASRIVQHHFAPLYGENPNTMILDLEFKFHGPERALFIKQARPYLNAF